MRTSTIRRLLLLRHGKAESPYGDKPDLDRKLTSRGERSARLIGQYLREHELVPDLVLCSPSTRTRETWGGVVGALRTKPTARYVEDLYEASTDTYLDQIRKHGGDAGTLLIIGHNPSTEAALTRLGSDGSYMLPDAFPTCALAVIESDTDSWTDLAPDNCSLATFVRPRDLGA